MNSKYFDVAELIYYRIYIEFKHNKYLDFNLYQILKL